jgi:hypothetical protein
MTNTMRDTTRSKPAAFSPEASALLIQQAGLMEAFCEAQDRLRALAISDAHVAHVTRAGATLAAIARHEFRLALRDAQIGSVQLLEKETV